MLQSRTYRQEIETLLTTEARDYLARGADDDVVSDL